MVDFQYAHVLTEAEQPPTPVEAYLESTGGPGGGPAAEWASRTSGGGAGGAEPPPVTLPPGEGQGGYRQHPAVTPDLPQPPTPEVQAAVAKSRALLGATTEKGVPRRTLESAAASLAGSGLYGPEAAKGGSTRVPGQWFPHGEKVSRERKGGAPPASAIAAYLDAQQLQGQAAGERMVYDNAYAQKQAGLADEREKLQREYVSGKKQRDAFVERVVGTHRAALERMEKDVQAEKLKPLDHWAKGTFLGALFGALGGLAQGLSGAAENPFWKSVHYDIEKRYQAQRDDIGKKERAIDRKNNLVEALQKIHGDAEAAKLAYVTLEQAALETQLKKLALEKEGTLEGTKYKEALAGLMMERAKTFDAWQQRMYGKTTEQADRVFVQPHVVGGGAARGGHPLLRGLKKAEQDRVNAQWSKENDLGLPGKRIAVNMLGGTIGAVDKTTGDKIAAALRAGDAGIASQIAAQWLESNPAHSRTVAVAMAAKLRAQSGITSRPDEKAHFDGLAAVWADEKVGVIPLTQAFTTELNATEKEAARGDPGAHVWLRFAEKWSRENLPDVGMAPSEKAEAP